MTHANPRPDITHHGSLRERKKARTRASLREHALRLFAAQGYAETTVEQIAAAAEVSPSTFFRYYPTKEDVVLQDGMDERMMAAIKGQPPSLSPIAAIRAATREALESIPPEELQLFRTSTELTLTVPEVRARAMDEFARTIDQFANVVATRTGRPASDQNVRALAGAVLGVIMSATLPWAQVAEEVTDVQSLFTRIDESLSLLESGLPL